MLRWIRKQHAATNTPASNTQPMDESPQTTIEVPTSTPGRIDKIKTIAAKVTPSNAQIQGGIDVAAAIGHEVIRHNPAWSLGGSLAIKGARAASGKHAEHPVLARILDVADRTVHGTPDTTPTSQAPEQAREASIADKPARRSRWLRCIFYLYCAVRWLFGHRRHPQR